MSSPCARRFSTIPLILMVFRLLATFGDALRTGTWTRRVKEFPLSNGVVRPAHLHVGKRCETSKSPHFTKSGQEPVFQYRIALETRLKQLALFMISS
jgi:hypothetical protein